MRPMILLLIAFLFIGGCATTRRFPPNERPIGAVYSVKSNVAWSQADEGEYNCGPLTARFWRLSDL